MRSACTTQPARPNLRFGLHGRLIRHVAARNALQHVQVAGLEVRQRGQRRRRQARQRPLQQQRVPHALHLPGEAGSSTISQTFSSFCLQPFPGTCTPSTQVPSQGRHAPALAATALHHAASTMHLLEGIFSSDDMVWSAGALLNPTCMLLLCAASAGDRKRGALPPHHSACLARAQHRSRAATHPRICACRQPRLIRQC